MAWSLRLLSQLESGVMGVALRGGAMHGDREKKRRVWQRERQKRGRSLCRGLAGLSLGGGIETSTWLTRRGIARLPSPARQALPVAMIATATAHPGTAKAIAWVIAEHTIAQAAGLTTTTAVETTAARLSLAGPMTSEGHDTTAEVIATGPVRARPRAEVMGLIAIIASRSAAQAAGLTTTTAVETTAARLSLAGMNSPELRSRSAWRTWLSGGHRRSPRQSLSR